MGICVCYHELSPLIDQCVVELCSPAISMYNRTTCCPIYGLVQFDCERNFLNSIISKMDKHVVLLLINYIAVYNS